METIFRKVSMEERLPKERKEYFVLKGTNQLFCGAKFFDGNKFPFQEGDLPVRFWLEEIELPNDDVLEKRFPTNINEPSDIKGTNSDNLCKQLGAEWMRNFVLVSMSK